MLFAVVCLLVVGSAFAQKVTIDSAPYGDTCCVIPHLIKSHYYFKYVFQTTDPLSFDADYYCDNLNYAITSMIYLNSHVRNSRSIARLATQLVARHILDKKSKTSIAAMNNLIARAFRLRSRQLLDGPSPSSVVSILNRGLQSNNVRQNYADYIRRRVVFILRNVFTTKIVTYAERLELSMVLQTLTKMQVSIEQIVNASAPSVRPNDGTVLKVKAAIKGALLEVMNQQMNTFHQRGSYLAYFKALISSANVNAAITDIRLILNNLGSYRLSHSEINAVLTSAQSCLSVIHQMISGLVDGIESRNLEKVVAILATPLKLAGQGSSHTTVETYVKNLVSKSSWLVENIPKTPALRADAEKLLAKLTRFASSLKTVSKSEQKFHTKTLIFVETLVSNLQRDIINKW